jgi:ribonuclease VapC
MSSVTALECAIVVEARKGEKGGRELDLLLQKTRIELVPFTGENMEQARMAWRLYGKGNHPASLNFCDCCAYALSKISGQALLFKGNDFARTDVLRVLGERPSTPLMNIDLNATCYRQGFFNVRVEYDRHFAPHGEAIEIHLGDLRAPIIGKINRTAQQNGTARVMGHGALRDYFQSHFSPGDQLTVLIESPRRIRVQRVFPPPPS